MTQMMHSWNVVYVNVRNDFQITINPISVNRPEKQDSKLPKKPRSQLNINSSRLPAKGNLKNGYSVKRNTTDYAVFGDTKSQSSKCLQVKRNRIIESSDDEEDGEEDEKEAVSEEDDANRQKIKKGCSTPKRAKRLLGLDNEQLESVNKKIKMMKMSPDDHKFKYSYHNDEKKSRSDVKVETIQYQQLQKKQVKFVKDETQSLK
eukprot:TRINITY_DN4120_c0_g1_i5.p1 TRINITY_DN4120_c0_g1~~TRINITY_DN4120_c0_g1_i5.p1  ORF type:complete len:204 (-),score=24.03 TRINITY_DN4120_c0_g1_i5:9-620(-)